MADVLGQKASRRWCHPPPSAKESYQFHGREDRGAAAVQRSLDAVLVAAPVQGSPARRRDRDPQPRRRSTVRRLTARLHGCVREAKYPAPRGM